MVQWCDGDLISHFNYPLSQPAKWRKSFFTTSCVSQYSVWTGREKELRQVWHFWLFLPGKWDEQEVYFVMAAVLIIIIIIQFWWAFDLLEFFIQPRLRPIQGTIMRWWERGGGWDEGKQVTRSLGLTRQFGPLAVSLLIILVWPHSPSRHLPAPRNTNTLIVLLAEN